MRPIFFLLILFCLFKPSLAQESGIVTKGEGDCAQRDRIVIQTLGGHVLAEKYMGYFLYGFRVSGDLNKLGFRNVTVNDLDGKLYINSSNAGTSSAERWCKEER